MASANGSADKTPLISRSRANEKFRTAVRLFVGRGRRYSVTQLSAGTGISDRMIDSFMAPLDSTEYRKPDLEEVLTLLMFLGEDFANELLAPTGLGAFETPEGEVPPPSRVAVEAIQDAAELSELAERGARPHELREVGARMMARGARLHALSLSEQPGLFGRRRAA